MFVYKKNPVGIKLFSHVKTFFYNWKLIVMIRTSRLVLSPRYSIKPQDRVQSAKKRSE